MSLQINVTEIPSTTNLYGLGIGRSSTKDFKKDSQINRDYNIITCQPIAGAASFNKRSRPPRLSPIKRGGFDTKKPNNPTFTQAIRDSSEPPFYQAKSVDIPNCQSPAQTLQNGMSHSQKNLMNSSSVNYNFVSYTKLPNPDTLKTLKEKNDKVGFKTKAIAEFSDLTRLMSPNFNPDFQSTYKANPNSFRRSKGMCATLCQTEKSYGVAKAFRKFK